MAVFRGRPAQGLGPGGFSLVELLVVMFVGMMVTGLAFTIYRSSTGHYLNGESAIRAQRNLGDTLGIILRDVRMAGNGLSILGPRVRAVEFYGPTAHALSGGKVTVSASPGWFSPAGAGPGGYGAMALYGTDGGPDGPDTLTVFRSEIESPAPMGRVGSIGGGEVRTTGPLPVDAVRAGDVVAMVAGDRAVIFEAGPVSASGLGIKRGGRFTDAGPPPGFPAEGAALFNLRDVSVATYFVDGAAGRLMVDRHDRTVADFDDPATGAMVLADGVVDLQTYFFFAGDRVDPTGVGRDQSLSHARFSAEKVKALSVGLTVADPFGAPKGNHRRPALFNRKAGTGAGGRRYRSMMETIFVRN
ncbi:MAG: hypothetical protein LBF58_06815 [Deltaproteobacteria bacterium]|jgi:hypothetical protein|nr:hypothetical protein [Deltaproteobacteria bacterium]